MRLKHEDAGESAHPVDICEASHDARTECRTKLRQAPLRARSDRELMWELMAVRYNLSSLL